MIIKIVPELENERRTFGFEALTYTMNEFEVLTWKAAEDLGQQAVEDGFRVIWGRRHLYPNMSDIDHQQVIQLDIDLDLPNHQRIFVVGIACIYVMNEHGKTIDKFIN